MSSTIELSNVATLDLDRLPFDLFVYLADWKSEINPDVASNFFQSMKKTKWAQGKLREHLAHCAALYPTYWKGYAKAKKKVDSDFIFYRIQAIEKTIRQPDYKILCRDLEKLAKRILGKRYAKNAVFQELKTITAGKYKPKTAAQPKPSLASVSKTPTPAAKAQDKIEAEKEATAKVFDTPSEPKPAPEKKPPVVKPSATVAPVPTEPEEFMPQAFLDLNTIDRWEKGKLLLRCVQIHEEARDTKTFRFVAEPAVLFNYKPGQFMNIELELDGKRVVRSYTISSSPTRPNVVDITVKRVPGGLVSNWLHDNISPGSYISGKGPSGKFSMVEFPAPKILLVSAGSGVTPMMSMVRWIYDTESLVDVGFFHWASTEEDLIYKDELQLYDKQKETFHLAVSLTREDAYSDWNGYRDYISADLVTEAFPDAAERMVFVCGPEGFMKKARSIFKEIGHPEPMYLEESFGGPKKPKVKPKAAVPKAKPDSGKTEGIAKKNLFTGTDQSTGMVAIQFTESEMEIISGDNEQTVLEAAEECEIEMDSSCRSGTCGTCKALKVHGEVSMEGAAALTDEEVEEGYILTCVAYPEGFVKVEI